MAYSTRPTLPPLHTLDLPRGHTLPHIHELYDMDDMNRRNRQLNHPNAHQRSYPTTPSSTSPRTPSPSASYLRPRADSASTPTTPAFPFPAHKVRLVPTSFENADAVVLVPPPSAPNAPPSQPLLLVGPALERLRHPQRQLIKGARIHPYRIARPSDQRPPVEPSHTTARCTS